MEQSIDKMAELAADTIEELERRAGDLSTSWRAPWSSCATVP
jgi:hypothetical protein